MRSKAVILPVHSQFRFYSASILLLVTIVVHCNAQQGKIRCSSSSDCHSFAKCESPGNADKVCECRQGFEGDGTTCKDINECIQKLHQCSPQLVCNNNIGSYSCKPVLQNSVINPSLAIFVAGMSLLAVSCMGLCCRQTSKIKNRKYITRKLVYEASVASSKSECSGSSKVATSVSSSSVLRLSLMSPGAFKRKSIELFHSLKRRKPSRIKQQLKKQEQDVDSTNSVETAAASVETQKSFEENNEVKKDEFSIMPFPLSSLLETKNLDLRNFELPSFNISEILKNPEATVLEKINTMFSKDLETQKPKSSKNVLEFNDIDVQKEKMSTIMTKRKGFEFLEDNSQESTETLKSTGFSSSEVTESASTSATYFSKLSKDDDSNPTASL